MRRQRFNQPGNRKPGLPQQSKSPSPDGFVSRKDQRKQQKDVKKKAKQDHQLLRMGQQEANKQKTKNQKTRKEAEPILGKRQHAQISQGQKISKDKKQRAVPKDEHDEVWHGRNTDELDRLDGEIGYLERRLKTSSDAKAKKKLQKSIENEGLGIGFMDFLDDIENKVKAKSAAGYTRQEYDFNDDAKEVALDPAALGDIKQEPKERRGSSGSDQSGFGDLEEESYGEEMEDEGSEEEEEESEEEASEKMEESESDIEDDINPDDAVDFVQSSDSEDEQGSNENESGEEEQSSSGASGASEDNSGSSDSEAPELVPVKQENKAKVPELPKPKIDMPQTEKQIRSVLNKVSEGNMDPMFEQITKVVLELMPKDSLSFTRAYSKIFMQLNISLQQQMNAILSVNCVYVTALQRLHGDLIFAEVARDLYNVFVESHRCIKENSESAQDGKMKVKNILNCFLHFFLFKSCTGTILVDMIRLLLVSFTESDIEILIFILHNIGLQLRKEDPGAIKEIIDMALQRKNSYAVEIKMAEQNGVENVDKMKSKEKKINFLNMELADIKNNKGTVTLQVRSIEHLQTWLKRDEKLSSELNIKPIDLSAQLIDESQGKRTKWWTSDQNEDEQEVKGFSQPKNFKSESQTQNQIQELAKAQRMTTDIKKAVFQAIVSADDYLQAFANCQRLNLKSHQQREIIKVLTHCCISEKKLFNKFYALLAHRLIKENSQSFKYSYKYTLWDYLKSLSNLDVHQISNLAKLTAFLLSHLDIPLHFLKVVDFDPDNEEEPLSVSQAPVALFLHVLFEDLISTCSADAVSKVLRLGIPEEQAAFGKGLCQYLLTTFYKRMKKQNHDKIPKELEEKLQQLFDVIKEKQQNEFVAGSIRDRFKM